MNLKKPGRTWRSRNWGRVFIVAAILCFATQACFHDARPQQANNWYSARRIPNLISVPLTYQCFDYTCGVGAVQSVFWYYGKELRHDELAKVLGPDPIKGTNYRRMVEFARSLGFQVDVRTQMSLGDLKRLIDDRKPVIVLVQAWPDSPVKWSESWDEGHYAVAIGYDDRNNYLWMRQRSDITLLSLSQNFLIAGTTRMTRKN